MRAISFDDLDARYNSWTPLEFVGRNKYNIRLVRCKCDCGNVKDVRLDHLRSGSSKNCGCSRLVDYVGIRNGWLVILESVGVCPYGQMVRCKCDCGGEVITRAMSVISGNTQSCGCLVSAANEEIAKWLKSNRYKFEREYRDCRCRRKILLPFDFAVWIDNIPRLIEFNGIHHYEEIKFGGAERLARVKDSDAIKEDFCIKHGVPLLVIAYWDKSQMFDMIKQFLD